MMTPSAAGYSVCLLYTPFVGCLLKGAVGCRWEGAVIEDRLATSPDGVTRSCF